MLQELRHRIWHFTFPRGRDIYLDESILVSNGLNSVVQVRHWNTPVAFKVNRESHQESKRVHFNFYTEGSGKDEREALVPSPHGFSLHLNTHLDTVILDINFMFSHGSRRMAWLNNTKDQYPTFLSTIHHLDLQEMVFSCRLFHDFVGDDDGQAIPRLKPFLACLQNLKTLTITEYPG